MTCHLCLRASIHVDTAREVAFKLESTQRVQTSAKTDDTC